MRKKFRLVGYGEYVPASLCFADGEDAGTPDGGGGSFDNFVDGILAKLDQPAPDSGDTGGEQDAETQQDQVADSDAGGDDGAADENPPSADDEGDAPEPEETLPAIEPPLSWTKEQREHWTKLPRETQQYLQSREQQRDAEVNRSQREVAEVRRSIDAEKAAFAQERQRYAEQLRTIVPLIENLDPIIAAGDRTDWVKLAQEDPAGYVVRQQQYQQRKVEVANAIQQRNAIEAQMMQEHLANEGRKLVEAVSDWHDPDENKAIEKARAGIDAIRKGAVEKYGFRPEEVAIIRDHRIARMAKDAIAYHELKAASDKAEAERATAAKAAEKKLKAPSPRLAASSGQSQGNTGQPSRSTNVALRKIGRDTSRSDDERIDAILAQL